MGESKKSWNDQRMKKTIIKIGGGGGGGIGAVVLLGGVLATAALASAFVVRGKGRSSAKDRRHRHQKHPQPEINKQSKQDEANKEQEFAFPDQASNAYKNPSEGAKKEIESNNDTDFSVSTQSLTLDEKGRVEINGGTVGDVEISEQILTLISPKRLEKDAISEDGFVVVEPQNKMPEDEKIEVQLTEEDVSYDDSKENEHVDHVYIEDERAEREHTDDGKIEAKGDEKAIEVTEMQPTQEQINTQVCYDQEDVEVTVVDNAVEGVHIDQKDGEKNENMEMNMEKKELEGLCSGIGEINKEKCVEAIERAKVDLSEDGIGSNQEEIGNESYPSEIFVSESHSEDGEKTIQPVLDSLVIEHENVEEGALPMRTVEIVQEDEAIEGSRKDQVIYIEEKSVEEEEKCDQPDEGIVLEKSEEIEWMDEAKQSDRLNDVMEENQENTFITYGNKEENGCIVHPTSENILPVLEEMISPEDTEVTKEDAARADVVDCLEAYKNKTLMQFDAQKNGREVEEELISLEDIETTNNGANEEVIESLEMNKNGSSIQFPISQPKDHKDDLEGDTEKEVEEELIVGENFGGTKDEIVNKDVAESAEESETKSLVQLVVGQPKENEDDFEGSMRGEVEDLFETIHAGIAIAKDGLITKVSDDEEKDIADKIKDFKDEAASSDEVEESSEGTGDSLVDSSTDSNWEAESPKEFSMEPQQERLTNYEVKGKIQEDKEAVTECEEDNQIIDEESSFQPHQMKAEENNSKKSIENFPTGAYSSQLPDENYDSEKTIFQKYVMDQETPKDHPTNSTRRRMVIGTLSLLSSLSCSWYFGLSFVKLCLVLFLTIVVSELHGF